MAILIWWQIYKGQVYSLSLSFFLHICMYLKIKSVWKTCFVHAGKENIMNSLVKLTVWFYLALYDSKAWAKTCIVANTGIASMQLRHPPHHPPPHLTHGGYLRVTYYVYHILFLEGDTLWNPPFIVSVLFYGDVKHGKQCMLPKYVRKA